MAKIGVRSVLYTIAFLIVSPLVILYLFLNPQYRVDSVVFLTKSGQLRINVEIADSPMKQMIGLMNRTSLPENAGMLFVFGDESVRHFWMKDTLIPLDMIFISADKQIVSIVKNAEPCKVLVCPTYSSEFPAKYVVEVNGGFADKNKINIGGSVEINL